MKQVLKTIYHPDADRRVLIVRHDNGFYGFEEEKLADPYEGYELMEGREKMWMILDQRPFCVCDSAEIAEHEARGRVEWLAKI